MTDEAQFRWASASRSHVGLVRSKNEDAYLDRPERGLWAVADGMGGHALGDVASRVVIDSLNGLPAPNDLVQALAATRERLQSANRLLRTEAAVRDLPVIGSTVVVLLACGRMCGCLWAGDSRIYLYRDGRIRQLTRDHSQLAVFRSQAGVDAEEIVARPPRNMITRAVGAADELDIDEEAMIVNDGDMFLLCSDGLSNTVNEQEMRSALIGGDCPQAVDLLIELALKYGGRDNISVVVVRADDMDSNDRTMLNPAL